MKAKCITISNTHRRAYLAQISMIGNAFFLNEVVISLSDFLVPIDLNDSIQAAAIF